MRTNVRLLAAATFVAAVAVSAAGCTGSSPSKSGSTGCASDTECRGDRICESGECVSLDNNEQNIQINNGSNNRSNNNTIVNPNNTTVGPNNVTIPPVNNETNNIVVNPGGCIEVGPTEDGVDFGPATLGQTATRTLVVSNCSATEDLAVSAISICTQGSGGCVAGGAFGLDAMSLPQSYPAILEPDETANFIVTFAPTDLTDYEGELEVRSSDPAKSRVVIPTYGEGTDSSCPQAVAQGRPAGTTQWSTDFSTIPLKTIELDGSMSADPDGSVQSYQWDLVQKPINSTVSFSPSSSVLDPDLFLDLAGEYVVELTVFDDQGVASCGAPAIVRINAVPEEDLHIQLVWDTPTDANQTDQNGTDLDLHFLHPNGSWNAAPWDIYWLNPTAEWGAPGMADDPSLDIDDSNGAGPENINFSGPEALTYAVGAYYYADQGFGPSYATIRIFVDGVMAYEYRDMFLPSIQTFWYAATIQYPGGQVFAVNQVDTGFPN